MELSFRTLNFFTSDGTACEDTVGLTFVGWASGDSYFESSRDMRPPSLRARRDFVGDVATRVTPASGMNDGDVGSSRAVAKRGPCRRRKMDDPRGRTDAAARHLPTICG